ncbi:hypothetical protein [Clostridium sporogenes]|uniref:hypothetical protein n=1 Tax=Clostridium sporogenes TaxID=1509 RepID=UPI0022390E82|nr:hypothetical protein [Clostridium sporogenes]MCW6088162.1 hypothetical protein [Clostridium sporogenes]
MFFFFFNNHADELREVAESDEIKAVIESEEYYFQKAIDKYIQYKEINVSEDILKQLIEQAETKPFSYEKWLSSYSKETKEYKMLKIIGELVSYIDRNASMKNKLNEYDDKRTMALAYVRQNVWLKNFLKLKLDGNLQNLTEIIENAIKYIENPDKVICVFKEQ